MTETEDSNRDIMKVRYIQHNEQMIKPNNLELPLKTGTEKIMKKDLSLNTHQLL